MNVLKHHNFTATKYGDQITVEQDNGLGEVHSIALNVDQLVLIARHARVDNRETFVVEDLRRKIAVLTSRLTSLVEAQWFRDSVVSGQEGIEAMSTLDGIHALALEFDGGRLLPDDDPPDEPSPPPVGDTRRTTNTDKLELHV